LKLNSYQIGGGLEWLELQIVRDELSTLAPIIKMRELERGRPNARAHELGYAALVVGRQQQRLPIRINVLELILEVLDILEHELLLLGVRVVRLGVVLGVEALDGMWGEHGRRDHRLNYLDELFLELLELLALDLSRRLIYVQVKVDTVLFLQFVLFKQKKKVNFHKRLGLIFC
jgi:hypothetical protein